ncbi:hypothetical protein ABPG75_008523 [Micractinium tetrahymenae]
MPGAHVVLFSTSCAPTAKGKSDINRIKCLLDAKRVQYDEIDLAMEPQRREAMLAGSDGLRSIPQLHVNGRYIGGAEELQEFEDWGELDDLLQGLTPEEGHLAAAPSPAPAGPTPGRSSAAAAAAVAAIQASAGSIIDRALKAAQRLDAEAQQQQQGGQQPASRAAVAALEQVAAELPSPDAAHLICSPIKLRRDLPELQQAQQQAQHSA